MTIWNNLKNFKKWEVVWDYGDWGMCLFVNWGCRELKDNWLTQIREESAVIKVMMSLRSVCKMPRWEPAQCNGNPASSWIILNVSFHQVNVGASTNTYYNWDSDIHPWIFQNRGDGFVADIMSLCNWLKNIWLLTNGGSHRPQSRNKGGRIKSDSRLPIP